MGGRCSCYHDSHSDERLIEEHTNLVEMDRSPVLEQLHQSPETLKNYEVIVEVDFDVDQIIWIQSLLRGFQERRKARKHFKKNSLSSKKSGKKHATNTSKRVSMDLNQTAREVAELQVDEIPEYLTQAVKNIQAQLGPYSVQMKSEKGLKKKGPVLIDNRAVYTGHWNNLDQRHGRGVQTSSDGSIYEGYLKFDACCGKGRLIKYNGDYYQGDFQDDMFHGYGLMMEKDGSSYEGEWTFGLKHGIGTEVIKDISTYKGHFENDEKSGDGKIDFTNKDSYEGTFLNGKFEGFGKFIWKDGRCYEGEWSEGKMHGRGTFEWKDGRVYEGDYIMDKKHGTGTFKWPDGRIYEGSWKEDKQDGEGTYTTSIGTRTGLWKNGKRVND